MSMSTRIEDLDDVINKDIPDPPIEKKQEEHVTYEEVQPKAKDISTTSFLKSYFTENNLIIFLFLLIASFPFLDTYLSKVIGKNIGEIISPAVLKAIFLFVAYLFIQGQFT